MRRLVIVTFLLLALAMGGAAWLLRQVDVTGPLASPVEMTIPAGTGSRAMAKQLAAAGVIAYPWLFEGYVRVRGVAGRLKAGEYRFNKGVSLRHVVEKLAEGAVVQRSLTIPEGYTVKQVLALLAAREDLKGEALPIPAEGDVFPDTYNFSAGTSRPTLLATMTARMETEVAAAWKSRASDTPLETAEELLILASIVQKEAANEAEMPQIAGVFTNRLRKGMKLQADPTVIYGADLKDNDLKSKDMKEDHPFNTYVHAGLPPTPIANPGRAALRAAANPARTDALFFMALPDRSGHVFSRDYATHQKAVKAYWAAYNQRKKEGQ
ncbi:MAG: endolytic transglycosylase MltG [Pseudomonadaceae bacterium]|nr:endolytic transglycosylase MltG [Pseudomonadaceae bacterium]